MKRVQQCHTVSKQQVRPRTKLPVKYLAHRTFESISLSDLETRVPSRLTGCTLGTASPRATSPRAAQWGKNRNRTRRKTPLAC